MRNEFVRNRSTSGGWVTSYFICLRIIFFYKKEIKINQRITYLHEKVSCPYFVHHLLTFDISSSVRTVGINQFRERDNKIALLGICSRGVQFYFPSCISSSNSLLQFFPFFNSLCCECYSLSVAKHVGDAVFNSSMKGFSRTKLNLLFLML